MTARYALYFAPPPDSALWKFASRWLGRDAATGETLDPPDGVSPDWTADPRRYGFHATLKPPMALAPGRDEAELLAAAADFAAGHTRFTAPSLRLAELGRFLALIPSAPSEALDEFAAECVRAFDPFRAPPPASDLEKRRAHGLTPRQDDYLRHWGYPYVFEEFRFHMTLTSSLDDDARTAARSLLEPAVAPFTRDPLVIDALSIFKQDTRDAPFRIIARFGLP